MYWKLLIPCKGISDLIVRAILVPEPSPGVCHNLSYPSASMIDLACIELTSPEIISNKLGLLLADYRQ